LGEVEGWSPAVPYDVVFSNATLHWIAHHRVLLPRLMTHVADGGTLAFQVPRNFDAPSHVLMREVAKGGPWAANLANARQVNVLSPDAYFDILAPLAVSLDIWETTYLHVLEGEDPVLTWVSGTGLRPFVQPLDAEEREQFLAQYRARLREAYPRRADGKTLLPFQRLFVVAQR
jgi:trans-aconitate 2-methyltransferase